MSAGIATLCRASDGVQMPCLEPPLYVTIQHDLVSGILGAYIVSFPRARVKALIPIFVIFLFRELPAWVFIGLWFALQVANGLGNLWMTEIGSGVAWWAHIGGFAAGAIVGLIGRAVLGPPPPPERRL